MTNIFEVATEFIDLDCRRTRITHPTTVESVYKKCQVHLPKSSIEDKTILDLGSAMGASGHYALTYGAKHYTGVEIQNYYVTHSNNLLSKYWESDKFIIVQQEIEDFLDEKIAQNIKYDYVLALGVIYCFLNIISILDKLCKITKEALVIETINYPESTNDKNHGEILITRSQPMVKSVDDFTTHIYYEGIASRISLNALDIVMSTNSFTRTEDVLIPEEIKDSYDPYRKLYNKFENNKLAPLRYIARYTPNHIESKTLRDTVMSGDSVNITKKVWTFDDSVAERFQHEAETNIPSYHIVIDKCLSFANKHLNKSSKIIDVGSALGYTISKFINAGFNNVMGVDNSIAMIEKSVHKALVICSDSLPNYTYDLIMMNWTLHFVTDKKTYLSTIYKSLNENGYLILSDKCVQTDIVKDMYYDFKRNHGVSEEYIKQKEQNLVGVMHLNSVDWYLKTLRDLGFAVDIIHGDLGFMTFLCHKA
jgi:SAM-dependent methyltransferase